MSFTRTRTKACNTSAFINLLPGASRKRFEESLSDNIFYRGNRRGDKYFIVHAKYFNPDFNPVSTIVGEL